MNKAAYAFKEYGTMDADGNNICPETFIVNFTHSSGNNQIETILSTDEVAQYTVANIFGAWAPDQIAAQVRPDTATINTTIGDLNWTGNAAAYLVTVNEDKLITSATTLGNIPSGAEVTVRAANGRGGFGPAIVPTPTATSTDRLQGEEKVQKLFQNGQVIILKDGVRYNALGSVIR